MNRGEFQSLTVERLEDAASLLKAERYSAAYCLSGYAIECALKACIAGRTKQDEFPPKDAAKYYVHDLLKLLNIADLDSTFEQERKLDAAFETNWTVVKDWTEEARYQSRGKQKAEEILAAINDPQHGVLQWLKRNW
jgi:HEPN domain-containing protein